MERKKNIEIVVAYGIPNRLIGIYGHLPWEPLAVDMKRFHDLTVRTKNSGMINAVIMGRSTWDSLPVNARPLSKRLNIVLSTKRDTCFESPPLVKESLDAAVGYCQEIQEVETIFVIGGESVFEEALQVCDTIHATEVFFGCEMLPPSPASKARYFPRIPDCFVRHSECSLYKEKDIMFEFVTFSRKKDCFEERQYLSLIKQTLSLGIYRDDRTGTGTWSIFGSTMRFNLRNGRIPLLTTKKVFWRGIVEELLWFISGSTNSLDLAKKNVHIWDANGSKEFLDNSGFSHREEGDLGPIYGFQWRHFGAEYIDNETNYSGKGIDQLQHVIDLLKSNPSSRRIVLCSWNVKDLHLMALPPCHVLCQFFVDSSQGLTCLLYQRSGDLGLGVPFNMASYGLLTHMIAQVCGLQAVELIHVIGDCHIYANHVAPLQQQLLREPYPFPSISLNPHCKKIDDFRMEDITLNDYQFHAGIPMKLSV